MTTLTELQSNLDQTQEELDTAKGDMEGFNNDPLAHFEDGITTSYDAMLDEQYEEVLSEVDFINVGGAELMKEHDNTMYRCGLNDYADSYDLNSIEEYQDFEDLIEELEDSVADLEATIEELEEYEESH